MAERIILHVDMDAFYASVEERDHPELAGKPLVIGADPRGGNGRGVACTANYAARAYGIHSAMPISQAYRLCPDANFRAPEFSKYKEASRHVMETLARYADVLQVVGMDEAYLDVTERCGTWERVPSFCRSLQAAVRRATGLTCSVGAAPCKQVAKVASDYRKPHGVTAVRPAEIQAFLDPLPVGKLHGCGPKSAKHLEELGYRTVEDLRLASRAELERSCGSHGVWLHEVARGNDPREVQAERGPAKSRGNESTFGRDVLEPAAVLERAQALLTGLVADARTDKRGFATLTVKVRYKGFMTPTRSHTFPTHLAPDDPQALLSASAVMHSLLEPLLDGRPIRLVGVRLSNFECGQGQRSLASWGVRSGSAPRPRRARVIDWARIPHQLALTIA